MNEQGKQDANPRQALARAIVRRAVVEGAVTVDVVAELLAPGAPPTARAARELVRDVIGGLVEAGFLRRNADGSYSAAAPVVMG